MKTFETGEPLRSLDEIIEQEFIFCHGKLYHFGWFKNWTAKDLLRLAKGGHLFKAVRKQPAATEDRP